MSDVKIFTMMRGKPHLTSQMIRSLRETSTIPYEMLVIENPSSEPYHPVEAEHPVQVLVKETANVSESTNLGFDMCFSDPAINYVLCVNNDILFGPRTVEHLRQGIEKFKLWCLSPMVVDHQKPANWREMSQEIADKSLEIHEPSDILGCCFMISREAWESGERYDENFEFWWCEADYNKRLCMMGRAPKRIQNAVVVHLVGQTAAAYPDTLEKNSRSYRYYKKKWNEPL